MQNVIIKNYRLVVSLFILGLIAVSSLVAPWIVKHDPIAQLSPSSNRFSPPSWQHWFGTDQFGRDVFSRVVYGGRVSLFIAISVVFFAALFGTGYGALSGYLGKFWDQILMRLVDMLLAFPMVFLAVTCMALFGSGLFWLIAVLTLTSWMDVARLVRAEVHSMKQRPFILKARAVGLNNMKIIGRHLIPNVMPTVLTISVIRVADIILIESALSFLGLGVQPPVASWGAIISDGRSVLASAWWLAAFPGTAIVLTTLSVNQISEGLRLLKN